MNRFLVLASFSLAFATSLVPTYAQGPGAIAGSVFDEDGHAVSGAEISLPDLRRRTTSDAEGHFKFQDLPSGDYLLEGFSAEWGKGVGRVTVSASEVAEVSITLEISHIRDTVVVSAGADPRSLLEIAQTTSVLDGDVLSLRLQPTLGETLSREPGINSTFFGPGASRPIIRGLGGDRIRMLQGGLGTGDVSSTSPDHAVGADPMTATRIEVLRGPATLLYGNSAIGGVVNVLDDRIPEYPASISFSGTAEVRGGSSAEERAGALNLNGGGGAWAWHADVLSRRTGDYDIPGFADVNGEAHGTADEEVEEEEPFGTVPNSDLESLGGSLGGTYFFGDKGSIGISISSLTSEYGLPGGHGHEEEESGDPEFEEGAELDEEGPVRIDLNRRRFDLRAEGRQTFGPFRGYRLRAGLVDYEHKELEGGIVGTTFFNDSYEARLELIQKPKGRLSGTLGLQIKNEALKVVGDEAFLPETDSTQLAAFAFEEIERGKLRYQFGARFESSQIDTVSEALPDLSFDGLSASLGVVWHPREDYAVVASLARSVKTPNSQELFSEGLHVATRSFEIGDVSLGRETSLGLDLALRKLAGRLTGDVTFFSNRFNDFIFQAFTGEEADGFPVVRYTQADSEFYGAELKGRYGLFENDDHHLDLEFSGDLVRGKLSDADDSLPRVPPQRLGAGLHYHGGPIQALAEVLWVDRQTRISDNETPTAGYTLVNASFGYRFFLKKRVLDVLLRGNNLTNEDARSHASFLKDTVPLPGRDLGLAVKLWF